MISKKQKFFTIILIIILTAGIVGGAFCISYIKGGITFPWQVASIVEDNKEAEAEVVEEQPKETVVVKVVEKTEEKQAKVEEPEETKEPEETVSGDSTGNMLDYYGALSVKDGVLVDSQGNEARLTGVSSHGLSWFPEFVTAESIKSLRNDWGVNVIRLAMYTSDYNGYCVGGDSNQQVLKDKIDEAVKAATDNEMYVIIDWHILNDNNPNEYKSQAIQFFGEMVRKYKDNENVIYEICNEPNGDTTWEDIKVYADEVIPVIRNVDKDALILVGTPKWSSDIKSAAADPLDYDNIMYTYHFYAATHKTSARNDLEDAIESGLPVFISEYGLVSADGNGGLDKRESNKWYDLIDEYNISSCIWNLSNKNEGSALISSDSSATSAWAYDDLSEEGKFFFDYLKNGD